MYKKLGRGSKIDQEELLAILMEYGEFSPSIEGLARKFKCTPAAVYHVIKKFKRMGIEVPKKYRIGWYKERATKIREAVLEKKNEWIGEQPQNVVVTSYPRMKGFYTRNCNLAAALCARGHDLIAINKFSEDRGEFVFSDSRELQLDCDQFWQKTLAVDAFTFITQINTLKEQIHCLPLRS